MVASAFGGKETLYFYELTPEKILSAVERSTGLICTGRALALNSLENRVYEIEIELDTKPKDPAERFVIVKFYRPGRWNEAQILDEHEFLRHLVEEEIPAVAPLTLQDGRTLHQLEDSGIFYAIFPKVGGRSPDELTDEHLEQVGRLLARMHAVGATKTAAHRIQLNQASYGLTHLEYLLEQNLVPPTVRTAYAATVTKICETCEPWFAATAMQRIHGDCHLGNLLHGRSGFFWVDFDDMVVGPPVQDIWLLLPGRDEYAQRQLAVLLSAYETMRNFDRSSLKLIEALRALRMIHFSAWIARRRQDPAFVRAFPQFGSELYWSEQLTDLREQLELITTTGPSLNL